MNKAIVVTLHLSNPCYWRVILLHITGWITTNNKLLHRKSKNFYWLTTGCFSYYRYISSIFLWSVKCYIFVCYRLDHDQQAPGPWKQESVLADGVRSGQGCRPSQLMGVCPHRGGRCQRQHSSDVPACVLPRRDGEQSRRYIGSAAPGKRLRWRAKQ